MQLLIFLDFVFPDSIPNCKLDLLSLFPSQLSIPYLLFRKHGCNLVNRLLLSTEYRLDPPWGCTIGPQMDRCASHVFALDLYYNDWMLTGKASAMSDILEKGGVNCRKVKWPAWVTQPTLAKLGQSTKSPDYWVNTSVPCGSTIITAPKDKPDLWARSCYYAHISDELRIREFK